MSILSLMQEVMSKTTEKRNMHPCIQPSPVVSMLIEEKNLFSKYIVSGVGKVIPNC